MFGQEQPDGAIVCFQCHEYVLVFANNFHNKKLVNFFEGKHMGHMRQTIDIAELDPNIYRLCGMRDNAL